MESSAEFQTKVSARSDLLRPYNILDTPDEEAYDDLVRYLSEVCEVPIALVSILDDDRQWFKAKVGLDVCQTPRDISFCNHALVLRDVFIVPDAKADPRFVDNPLVKGSPNIRFYAGAPLVTADGEILGTVCMIDRVPRELSPRQLRTLKLISRQVANLLDLRKANSSMNLLLARQTALLARIGAAILAETSEHKIFMINEEFRTLFGIETEFKELIGKETSSLFAKVEKHFKDAAFKLVHTEQKESNEVEFTDGRFFECDYMPIRSDVGGDLGGVWTFRDITQRKQTEIFIDTQRSEATEVSKLKALGEMAGGISHEINNPMTIIHGRAAILREMAKSGKLDVKAVQENAETIVTFVIRVAAIIRGLRAFARSGENDDFEIVSVNGLLEDTLIFCNEAMKFNQIQLELKVPAGEIVIECRRVQISQVLLNLLRNAFDAVHDQPERRVRIEVVEKTNLVEISIEDNGSGVPHEVRDKIFEPFFTTKGGAKGTGLGLSISRGIAEDHEGQLILDSTKSPGARFVLSLPKSQR